MKNTDVCENRHIHPGTVKTVFRKLPDGVRMRFMSDFFKAFADPTRLGILHALRVSEICVCDISSILSMEQSAVSHQLKILKMHNLVKSRREGKTIYYSLADDHVSKILTLGADHVEELM